MKALAPLTFLFTDIEGSTRLWEQNEPSMRAAVARHDDVLRQHFQHAGHIFKTTGDGFLVAFASPREAVESAILAQEALVGCDWGETTIRVRMAIHTGEAEARDGDYFGPPLNRTSRLMSIGHGGQILVSMATFELVRDVLPAEASFLDIGEHRLRDLERPQRVYQLAYPGLPTDFPVPRSLTELPNNLPLQVTSFIGRDQELAEVCALLGKHRLVTLTGSGGTGKTRLSLQAAAEMLAELPDGAWLMELAALTEPSLVPQVLATNLKVREEADQSLTETLISYLRDKQLLLILDNCEHLLEASALLVETILRACPHVTVLASSREPLSIGGEQVYRVPSLSTPNLKRRATLESLRQFDAVHLFIDRVLLAQPTFQVTNENAPAVAQICHRLDGIPLALELAAARVRSIPVETIASRLDDRFRLLTGGSRTALARHQTLRAAIDWSYGLLDETEKRFLRRLSVFAGGWSPEMAEAVCADPDDGDLSEWDILDLLSRLVEKSIVAYDVDAGRYLLLETVRQFAVEALESAKEDGPMRDRHLTAIVGLSESAAPGLIGGDQESWLTRLDSEIDNVRTAIGWCLRADAPDDRVADGMKVAANLWRFWDTRGYYTEGRDRLRALLGRDTRTTSPRALALDAAGRLAYYQGDFVASCAAFEEAAELFKALSDELGEHHALHGLAMAEANAGRHERVRSMLEQCLTVFRKHDDLLGMARALNALGFEALGHGDHERAEPLLEEALAVRIRLNDAQGETIVRRYLGICAARRGDSPTAREYLLSSAEVDRRIGYRRGIATSLTHLAAVALADAQLPGAIGYLREATEAAIEVEDISSLTGTLAVWAEVANRLSRPEIHARLLSCLHSSRAYLGAFPDAIMPPTPDELEECRTKFPGEISLGATMEPKAAARMAMLELA